MTSKPKTTATTEEAKPALLPKLRFPDFKNAPKWEVKPLGQVAENLDNRRVPITSNERKVGDVPYYGASGIVDYVEGFIFDEDLLCVSEDGANLVARTYPIAFPISGKTWVNNHAHVLKFENPCTQKFVELHLNAIMLDDFITGMAQPKLNKAMLDRIPIPYPTISEQQKIAECLSSVDEVIVAQARKLDALKTHKKGLMQQLFPGEGETKPRLRFPEFRDAGEWEKSPLTRFILSLDAGVSVNSGDSRPADKTEFGVLKTSAITKGQFDPEENKVVLAESELSRLKEPVTGGTIIMCRKNTPALVGASAYVESSHENLFLPDLLWAAKPREGVSMRFLSYILGSDKGRAALSKLAKGSSASMSNITKPEVLAFSVMAPSPAEQHRIAGCLSSLDALIAAEARKLEALKIHKKGLMQQLFPSLEKVKA